MIGAPSLSAVLSGAYGYAASGSQIGDVIRSPFVFTSTLRQRAARAGGLQAEGLGLAAVNNLVGTAIDVEWASSLRSAAFMPSIAMLVNPNSVKVTQPKRFTKKDTRSGSVYFHFTNSRGQNNDIATLAFSGNTGNIDLRGSLEKTAPGPNTGALQKLIVWHNLYLMSREPMLLPDNTENQFTITYASKLFPLQIDFHGFFSKILDFEESGKKPNSLDYSFEFVVTSTEPDLDDWLSGFGDALSTPVTLPTPSARHLSGKSNYGSSPGVDLQTSGGDQVG